jgi:hypothetical protein
MESGTSQTLLPFSRISSSTRALFNSSFTCWTDQCLQRHKCPLNHFRTLHLFLTCCTLITLSSCTSIKWRWILLGEHSFARKSRMTLRTSQNQVFNVAVNEHQLLPWIAQTDRQTEWLTDWLAPSVACYPYYKYYLVLNDEVFDWHKNYKLRNFIYWTVLLHSTVQPSCSNLFSKHDLLCTKHELLLSICRPVF